MNDSATETYRGMKTDDARQKIIEDLQAMDLVEKIEDYRHQAPKCSRCGAAIQLIPSMQWFIKMDELAKKALQAGKSGEIKFYPKRWEKLITRGSGNRAIGACRASCGGATFAGVVCEAEPDKYVVALKEPKECPICGECRPKRSEDVFDTWFSSALWPLAVLAGRLNQRFEKILPDLGFNHRPRYY